MHIQHRNMPGEKPEQGAQLSPLRDIGRIADTETSQERKVALDAKQAQRHSINLQRHFWLKFQTGANTKFTMQWC